jgi:hypothetical protein
MSLADGASALADWNVSVPPYKVGGPGPNKLIWYDNKNQRQTGFNTPFLNRFINLMGTNPGGLTVSIKQTGIALAPGPYLLQFWVGWDAARNPSGKVSVDWSVLQQEADGTSKTVAFGKAGTNGTSVNHWQFFSPVVTTSGGKNMTLQFSPTQGQPVGFIGLDNISMRMELSRACYGKTLPPIIK